MSELNNNEKENIVDPHLKKKGGIGALIFFIILYMICAAFVTYYNIRTNDYYQMGLIDYFKKHGTIPQFDVLFNKPDEATNNAISKNTSNNNVSQVNKTSVRDRYFLNNLKIEEIEDSYGEQVAIGNHGYDDNHFKGEINYPKISGLKDKDVETKINTLIKNKVLEKVYKYIDDDSIVRFSVNGYVYANYANLLSIEIYTYVAFPELDEWGYYQSDSKIETLNFRLDTGDQFKFKDLFVEGTSLKGVLSQAIYKDLAWDYLEVGGELNEDLSDTDYSEIETKVFIALSGLSQEDLENLQFTLSNTYLYVQIKDRSYSFKFRDFIDYLNIYNIAKTKESIFENGNLPQRDFVYMNPTLNSAYIYEKVADNIFVIAMESSDYEDENQEDEELNNYIRNKVIEEVKTGCKPDKGYIIAIEATHYPNYQSGGSTLHFNGQAVVVDKKDFNDKLIEDVLYALNYDYRDEGEFMYFSRLLYLDFSNLGFEFELPSNFEIYSIYNEDPDFSEEDKSEKRGNLYWHKEEKYVETEEEVEEPSTSEAGL